MGGSACPRPDVAPERIDDAALIARYLDTHDDTHFIALYERYATKVFRRSLSFCRNASDAEDLTQEIFVKVFLSLHRFRRESSFSTWLYRIATNHCLNYLRDRKEFLALEEGSGIEPALGAPASKPRASFREVLEKLPRAEQALLLLKFRDGYTYEEIAGETGISISALKMRISRARNQLKANKER